MCRYDYSQIEEDEEEQEQELGPHVSSLPGVGHEPLVPRPIQQQSQQHYDEEDQYAEVYQHRRLEQAEILRSVACEFPYYKQHIGNWNRLWNQYKDRMHEITSRINIEFKHNKAIEMFLIVVTVEDLEYMIDRIKYMMSCETNILNLECEYYVCRAIYIAKMMEIHFEQYDIADMFADAMNDLIRFEIHMKESFDY
jgi:hypothetical protein